MDDVLSSRWLSKEECREEKEFRDLQDSLLDFPVYGDPAGVWTDTEKDRSRSNFDLSANTSSLLSILSTTSPRVCIWLNIANSWLMICFHPVAAVLRRLRSMFWQKDWFIIDKRLKICLFRLPGCILFKFPLIWQELYNISGEYWHIYRHWPISHTQEKMVIWWKTESLH